MVTSTAMETTFTAIPVQRPREQVESQLRRAILDGTIATGSRLPGENTLAREFNVSRATVREALRSLIESGLLEKGAGTTSGLYVQSVDHHSLARVVSDRLTNVLDLGSVTPEEVAGFRDLLEIPSARLAAQNRSDEGLARLRAIIDAERTTTYDDPSVPELNARFHVEIANATGNRVLTAFVAALHRVAHPLAFVNADQELGRVAVAHHISLYRAIEASDSDTAAKEMREHLEYLRNHAKTSGAASGAIGQLGALLP